MNGLAMRARPIAVAAKNVPPRAPKASLAASGRSLCCSALSPMVCFRRDTAPLGPRGNLGTHYVLIAFLPADRCATDPGSVHPDRHASKRINQSTTAPALADETWRA